MGPTEVLQGVAPGAPAAAPQAAAPQATATPAPQPQAASPGPARDPSPSVPDAFSSGEDAGPSVWSTIAPGMGMIDKSLLPSSLPSATAPSTATPTASGGTALPPPSQVKPQRSEKTLLIVLGVLAVVAAIALVVVLKLTRKSGGPGDPVSIGIGDDPSGGFVPPPTATATATASAKVWGPKPKPKSTKAEDIYDEP